MPEKAFHPGSPFRQNLVRVVWRLRNHLKHLLNVLIGYPLMKEVGH